MVHNVVISARAIRQHLNEAKLMTENPSKT